MPSSDGSRMGSCPASNTMYYNVSSGERKGKEVTGGSVEDKEKPKGLKKKNGEITEEFS